MTSASFRAFALLLATLSPALFGASTGLPAYDGMVLPFKEVVVSSPVESTLMAVNVKEGDLVKAGQPLAQLYSKLEELDMKRAEAALEKRAFDDQGAQNLLAEKIMPADKALEAKIEHDLAKLQYDIAAEQVRLRSITSPLDGLVVEKMHEVGEAVTPALPLFRIIDFSRIYVQFFIKAEDLPRFHVGQELTARFPLLNGGQAFTGAIDFIDPRVDAASGLLRVKVLIENPARQIMAGMRAEVAPPVAP